METSDQHHASLVGRVAGRVTGKVVDVVDPNIVLDEIDVDRLLARIDPDDLLARVDVNALLDRIDVDRLMQRVDIDALLAKADVEGLVRRSGVPDIVASSTTHLAGSLIDVVRRQVVGLDTILHRAIDRVLRREIDPARFGPPALRPAAEEESKSGRLGVTGRYAGAFSRLLAAGADLLIASTVFTLLVAGSSVLTETFLDTSISDDRAGLWGILAWAGWGFLYIWVTLTISGRTPGMALVGIRIVTVHGFPIGPWQSLVRTIALPFSVAAGGLGLLMALPHPQHRAFHDLVARTAVVYDWGDRPAELPGPLSAYVARHAET